MYKILLELKKDFWNHPFGICCTGNLSRTTTSLNRCVPNIAIKVNTGSTAVHPQPLIYALLTALLRMVPFRRIYRYCPLALRAE